MNAFDVIFIGYDIDRWGWCLFRLVEGSLERVDDVGPYPSFDAAQESLRTMAARVKQGWRP